MDKWNELGEGWTPAIRSRCRDLCEGDPPCYALAGNGLVGGPIELITPCSECIGDLRAGDSDD